MENIKHKSTLRQYAYIRDYIQTHGYAPSLGEIQEFMGHKSKSSTQYHMEKLFDKGLLETDINVNGMRPPRAYRLGNPFGGTE